MIVALLDANILYPAPLRDLFMQLAVSDVFRARWTATIHDEWINALMRNEPERDRTKLERTRDLMNKATRDALIIGYESLIPSLKLPDEDDRHVLAAAIVGQCDTIVTKNITDFPKSVTDQHGIGVEHPDQFLFDRLTEHPDSFCAAVKKVRLRLKNPPYTVKQYLSILENQELSQTVQYLRKSVKLL